MKTMQKIFAILLAFVMVFALTACSPYPPMETPTEPPAQEPVVEVEPTQPNLPKETEPVEPIVTPVNNVIQTSEEMFEELPDDTTTYVVFVFNTLMPEGTYRLCDVDNNTIINCEAQAPFKYLLIVDEKLVPGTYTLWSGQDIVLEGYAISKPQAAPEEDTQLPTPPESVDPLAPGAQTEPIAPIPPSDGVVIPESPGVSIPMPPQNPIEPMDSKSKSSKKTELESNKEDKALNKKEKSKADESKRKEVSSEFVIESGPNYFYIVLAV